MCETNSSTQQRTLNFIQIFFPHYTKPISLNCCWINESNFLLCEHKYRSLTSRVDSVKIKTTTMCACSETCMYAIVTNCVKRKQRIEFMLKVWEREISKSQTTQLSLYNCTQETCALILYGIQLI